LTDIYEKIKRQNEMDAILAFQRDRKEKDELIYKHIHQYRQLSLCQRSETHIHKLKI